MGGWQLSNASARRTRPCCPGGAAGAADRTPGGATTSDRAPLTPHVARRSGGCGATAGVSAARSVFATSRPSAGRSTRSGGLPISASEPACRGNRFRPGPRSIPRSRGARRSGSTFHFGCFARVGCLVQAHIAMLSHPWLGPVFARRLSAYAVDDLTMWAEAFGRSPASGGGRMWGIATLDRHSRRGGVPMRH